MNFTEMNALHRDKLHRDEFLRFSYSHQMATLNNYGALPRDNVHVL